MDIKLSSYEDALVAYVVGDIASADDLRKLRSAAESIRQTRDRNVVVCFQESAEIDLDLAPLVAEEFAALGAHLKRRRGELLLAGISDENREKLPLSGLIFHRSCPDARRYLLFRGGGIRYVRPSARPLP